ncbi:MULTISPECIES: hypothetical protein [Moorena]|uniref:Uncharacterized protein n=1 Tax=Moorena producens 3L TaxID=489825 RepID=F4XI75_9CYAN|nr:MULTISPECIES: hypothetical protein [Moorena]EGJ33184.1 hypothetical protein LYNGBM3L_47290 [Moorena producens 3L]EGJ33240.1 hypothetical protein LYNGBM3L_39830 [Moorena producens 3L]EGJ34242.1 hypothetical protein LYNGBM3L_21680 [Moorena producens 3L]EGJ34302.1 hypothetical protein LYNGBM3L_18690 [Moorena producens 3L]EGJ35781.1 hypothetical protein LYNGBM3L_00420 [Moorena producens 3L]
MIQGYKSSIERLANLFKQSRDRWKQRASEKQKKLRAQEIRIRDLEKSRALWKRRAQIAEKEVRGYRQQTSSPSLSPLSDQTAVPPRP